MNSAQKKGVGALIALAAAVVVTVCEMAGVSTPTWLPTVVQVVTIVAGVFGISVNLPSQTR